MDRPVKDRFARLAAESIDASTKLVGGVSGNPADADQAEVDERLGLRDGARRQGKHRGEREGSFSHWFVWLGLNGSGSSFRQVTDLEHASE